MFRMLNIVYLTKSVQNYEFFFQKAKETDFFVYNLWVDFHKMI